MPRVTANGVPILSMREKLTALAYTIGRKDSLEDAAGHLVDLLEHVRQRITKNGLPIHADLAAIITKYGLTLAPVENSESEQIQFLIIRTEAERLANAIGACRPSFIEQLTFARDVEQLRNFANFAIDENERRVRKYIMEATE